MDFFFQGTPSLVFFFFSAAPTFILRLQHANGLSRAFSPTHITYRFEIHLQPILTDSLLCLLCLVDSLFWWFCVFVSLA